MNHSWSGRLALVVLVCVHVASGCASEDGARGVGSSAPDPAASTDTRERIVVVHEELEVPSAAGAVARARELTLAHEGYVESSRLDRTSRAYLELRVPTGELPALRTELAALGGVVSEDESAEDVTFAHADLEARLRNARAEEARLLEIVAERTSTLADVLTVERALADVRERIETLDAQDRATRDRVAMARVTLTLAQREPSFADAPIASIRDAALGGTRAAYVILVGLATVTAALAPTLVLGWLAFKLAALLVRSRRRPAS